MYVNRTTVNRFLIVIKVLKNKIDYFNSFYIILYLHTYYF